MDDNMKRTNRHYSKDSGCVTDFDVIIFLIT